MERLRRENEALRGRLAAVAGAQAEHDELQALLRLKDAGTYTTVLARVVGVGAATPFEATVTLDVGSRDGVREGQSVTSGRGLVGRTVRVGPGTSVVALLTDPAVTVGVRLEAATRSFGLASGRDSDGMELAVVRGQDAAPVQVGTGLVTAGSDTFVAGLPVGRVVSVPPAGRGVVPTASVRPYADLGALDLLQVVVAGPRSEPRVPLPPS